MSEHWIIRYAREDIANGGRGFALVAMPLVALDDLQELIDAGQVHLETHPWRIGGGTLDYVVPS